MIFIQALTSFLIAMLMGMGVGGGGLFLVYLTLCLNYPQTLARGTNLLFFAVAGVFSIFYHVKKRKILPWQVLIMIIFGGAGSIIFSRLVGFTDTGWAKIALGVLLVASGGISLYKSFIK